MTLHGNGSHVLSLGTHRTLTALSPRPHGTHTQTQAHTPPPHCVTSEDTCGSSRHSWAPVFLKHTPSNGTPQSGTPGDTLPPGTCTWGIPRGHPAEPDTHPLLPAQACVHAPGARGAPEGMAPDCCPETALPGTCVRRAPGSRVHPRSSSCSGQAGGRLLHVTSGGLLFKHHRVPPCSEPAMAPITGAKPASCSGSRPGMIGPTAAVPSSCLLISPDTASSSLALRHAPGPLHLLFHCLFPVFSLMRICMICSHSSFHHRAWARLPFLPPHPPPPDCSPGALHSPTPLFSRAQHHS